jgi:hypothetical protein|tara:strand:+ start:520 stop:924 length:405 start_codon:yes stop_codon:yes gene_type:complete
MANSNYTLDMSIISTYLEDYTGNVCCWQPGPLTYDDFLTGITKTYNNSCLEDKKIADYITTLYIQCLSGDSADGTHYWSRNVDGSISPTGLTTTVGLGTTTPNKPLTVVGDISGTTDLYVGNIIHFGSISGGTF